MVQAQRLCPESQVMGSMEKYTMSDVPHIENIKQGNIDLVPDMMVTIRPEVYWDKNKIIKPQYFDSEYRYELNPQLPTERILDKSWILKPIFIMPIVIFYNAQMQDPPRSWEDLLDKKYQGRIATTNEATPPVYLLKRFFKNTYGAQGTELVEKHITYLGPPIDVNRAITNKEYDIGIASLSFAMLSNNKISKLCWPKEGALYLTQTILLKKGYSDDSKKIADYLLSYETQKMFSDGAAFIPVRVDVEAPKLYIDNNQKLLDFP